MMQPRPASTLALLRDAEQGLEVLMLQRTHQAVFMPGFYVFPGGAVDAGDASDDFQGFIDGHDAVSANAMLGVEEGGLGYLLAALRECFEESGLLLARDRDGRWLDAHHPVLGGRWSVGTGETHLASLCRAHDLVLPLDGIAYLDHWVTPPGPPRRFDTRFFAAAAPPGQVPAHDGEETIDHCWLSPARALDDRREGRREFATPTISVLRKLSEFESVAQVLHYAREERPGSFPIRPWPARRGGEVVHVEPGTPAYDEVCKLDPDGKGEACADINHGHWVRLSARVWRLSAPAGNSYLVRGQGGWVVVDPGPDNPSHRAALLDQAGEGIQAILLTRASDQPAARALAQASGAPVHAFPDLSHGDTLSLGDTRLRALHCPGQSDDAGCYLLEDEGLLFSGRVVLERSLARAEIPGEGRDAYVAALARLLEEDLRWIAPGEGFLMGQPQRVLDHLITQCLSRQGR